VTPVARSKPELKFGLVYCVSVFERSGVSNWKPDFWESHSDSLFDGDQVCRFGGLDTAESRVGAAGIALP